MLKRICKGDFEMEKGRLEAFSDGVIAIIITITVLLLEPPAGEKLSDLAEIVPLVLVYTVSFIMIGMNWANHHHLLSPSVSVLRKSLVVQELDGLWTGYR